MNNQTLWFCDDGPHPHYEILISISQQRKRKNMFQKLNPGKDQKIIRSAPFNALKGSLKNPRGKRCCFFKKVEGSTTTRFKSL